MTDGSDSSHQPGTSQGALGGRAGRMHSARQLPGLDAQETAPSEGLGANNSLREPRRHGPFHRDSLW